MYIPNETYKNIKSSELFKGFIYTAWVLTFALLFVPNLSAFFQLVTFIIASYFLFIINTYNLDEEQLEFVEEAMLFMGTLLIAYGLVTSNPMYNYAGFLIYSMLIF